MRFWERARLLAGAFLLLLWPASRAPLAAEPLRIAAERVDSRCPGGRTLGIVHLESPRTPASDAPRCVVIVPVRELSDSALDQAVATLAKLPRIAAAVLEFSSPIDSARLPFAVKRLSSAIRAASPVAEVALDLETGLTPETEILLGDEELGPYADALVRRPGQGRVVSSNLTTRWVFISPSREASAASDVLNALQGEILSLPSVNLIGLLANPDRPLTEADWRVLERLQSYWTKDVSRDPTATRGTRGDGTSFEVLRFFDAKKFVPILFLSEHPSGRAEIELSGGPFAKASVENLTTGAKRDFELRGARALTLDLAKGPLAVVLQPSARAGGETRTSLEVGAVRGLTAEEIVARERAWDAAQRERVQAFVAEMDAALRFRVGRANETFDLTIRGPFFFRRGEPADWAWHEFYLNGVRWKGRTLPKLPILQPEKVTTLPLDIRLTEEYTYTLHGDVTVAGRRAYHITYAPKSTVAEKPIYRGSVWIDRETFALLRRESIQLNLKGETLSSIQNEYLEPVPGHPEIWLPLEIRGLQVFSTSGRTTAIERNVKMTAVVINPQDFSERRAAAYASEAQMVRDTDHGLRYLIPDPQSRRQRMVEETISKKSTLGLLGSFYDNSLDYPIPLLGLQHFNFDLWGKNKQLSLFFGGVLLTANYTDPSLGGSRFDLGADLFAVAVPFGDTSYRNGREVPEEKIKHLPAFFQVNVGRPVGPYLKTSLGIFSKWDNYKRDKQTGANFITPVDTFTDGAELRLVGNFSGFTATVSGSYFRRREWKAWGDPSTSEFDPRQRQYWKYSASIVKDHYFEGFRKLHVGLSYLGGSRLDRFSKYEFGAFSGNPIRGFKSGSVRTEKAFLADASYGLNFEDIIRFEALYDQAIVTDRQSGFDTTYFSGVGLRGSLNGPWENTILRFEIGFPVVRHGVNGFVVNAVLLKLF